MKPMDLTEALLSCPDFFHLCEAKLAADVSLYTLFRQSMLNLHTPDFLFKQLGQCKISQVIKRITEKIQRNKN